MADPDYAAVDAGDAAGLLATMDAASAWPAVRALRAWERDRLALRAGERLLDVGCGAGAAAVALAADLGPEGTVVGVDRSAAMLGATRARAGAAPGPVPVVRGDAAALAVAAGTFDAARCERTLQWVPDPARVVGELHRALRPGGRLVLIDSDWSTLVLETGDARIGAAVRAHVAVERRRPAHVGRRLRALGAAAGLVDLEATAATHVWPRWDPDRDPAPAGFFPIEGLAADLVRSGHVAPGDATGFVAAIEDAARRDELLMALTMYAVAGRRA